MRDAIRQKPLRAPLAVYGLTATAIVLVVVVHLALTQVVADRTYFVFLVIPVVVASWLGGRRPGIAAAILGPATTLAFGRGGFEDPTRLMGDLAGLGLYALTATGIIYVGDRQWKEREARIASECELERVNGELERMVAARTAELEAANAELASFCYSVAHDLRTPNRAMAGNARILLEDYAESLPPRLQEHLRRIQAAAVRQGDLIDALLTYARLANDPLSRTPVDVAALAREIKPGIERGELAEFELHLDGDIWVDADERQIRLALTSLIENGVRYRRAGQPAEVRMSIGTRGNLIVRDNGIGFDMQYEPKIRLPFERLHRDEAYRGIGMGLALVSRIAERHGGHIAFESVEGQGTVVRLDLGSPFRSTRETDSSSASNQNAASGTLPSPPWTSGAR